MQVKIDEVAIPERIDWNFTELKNELTEKVELYSTVVYTDDQIKSAKADRASLNKLKEALNAERIRRKKEYIKPFEEFEAQVAEVVAIIDKPIAVIDKQIKEVDEKRRNAKREEIGSVWVKMDRPEWLALPKIFNEKWLNVSYSMATIEAELGTTLEKVRADLGTLESLTEFNVEAIEVYKDTLDLGKAIAEGKRLAEIAKKRKEYEEQKKVSAPTPDPDEDFMPKPEEPSMWVTFSALLTVTQAKQLKRYFEINEIQFKAGGQ